VYRYVLDSKLKVLGVCCLVDVVRRLLEDETAQFEAARPPTPESRTNEADRKYS
jgi:hypothetical protein